MNEPSFHELIQRMDEVAWRNMRRAVETGRWADGRRLEPGQRELCLQAVLAWEARFLPPEQRTGHIERDSCESAVEEQPVRFPQSGEEHA